MDLRIGEIPGSIPAGLRIRNIAFQSNVGFLPRGLMLVTLLTSQYLSVSTYKMDSPSIWQAHCEHLSHVRAKPQALIIAVCE